MRRKKLTNNLTEWPRENVLAAMHAAGLDENARAEELALADFDKICHALTRFS
jgi:16S rRNA A1518/A1519 N6-dimethyltransferase RsmA/KsgA/DIM1 with predicted DNA glycosylase/AP lyase activity